MSSSHQQPPTKQPSQPAVPAPAQWRPNQTEKAFSLAAISTTVVAHLTESNDATAAELAS